MGLTVRSTATSQRSVLRVLLRDGVTVHMTRSSVRLRMAFSVAFADRHIVLEVHSVTMS